MSTNITRTQAKRLTLVYQGAALVCVLGAVAVGVVGLPESTAAAKINSVSQLPSAPIPGVVASGGEDAGGSGMGGTRIDPGSIAARLSMLDNAPKSAVVTDEPETVAAEPGPVVTKVGTLAKRVRYTGYINDNNQPLAFIRIDGTQRIVAEGGVARAGSMGLDDLTITRVRPEFIIVSDGQTQDRIELADKHGASFTVSSAVEIPPVGSPDRKTIDDVELTPEELASLEGLSARARGARISMLKRQKLGRPIQPHPKEPLASFTMNGGTPQQQSRDEEDQPRRERPERK